ncbi:hypothetical protein [Paraburkholderia sp. J63]|uniref:hypothetical protein n=1 Tax=Paraburkholderia sp. J63 TaxID=2805434 RepID=UPI002ABD2F2D|nr:hypothetical protein [Paraburkholderia sp. J63]
MKPATPIVITTAALSSSLAFAQIPTPGIVVSPENRSGDAKMHELISMPKTAADFIKNIKYAFDNNLFLDDRFFEKSNVCKAFSIDEKACDPHEVHLPDGTHGMTLGANIEMFAQEPISNQPNSTQHHHPKHAGHRSTAQILIDNRIDPNGVVSGGINFTTQRGGPDFMKTVQILNVNLTESIEMPPHGKIPIPVTGPHGDETWRYEISTEHLKKKLVIGFLSDGTLESMLVEIYEIGGHQ